MVLKRAPQGGKRRNPEQTRKARQPDAQGEFNRAGLGPEDEAIAQRLVDRLGALAEPAIPVGLANSGEAGDGFGALVNVGIEVEARAVPPGMARESDALGALASARGADLCFN